MSALACTGPAPYRSRGRGLRGVSTEAISDARDVSTTDAEIRIGVALQRRGLAAAQARLDDARIRTRQAVEAVRDLAAAIAEDSIHGAASLRAAVERVTVAEAHEVAAEAGVSTIETAIEVLSECLE